MNERKKEQDENMVQCPACNGQGGFRGPETRIKWFECAYCYGTGGVTEARFHAWHDDTNRSARYPVSGS
jgi:DnaJ-class molecular chaperone